MICEKDKNTLQRLRHWNYFLAIEQDLIKISRFIEFSPDNYKTYSLELARLLIASTSEVDVLLKEICTSDKKSKDRGINDYRDFFKSAEEWDIQREDFIRQMTLLPRYNLYLSPWESWQNGGKDAPEWWTANNKVKHHRSDSFDQANLYNVLNSVAALFAVNLYRISPLHDALVLSGLAEEPKLFKSELTATFGWGGRIL